MKNNFLLWMGAKNTVGEMNLWRVWEKGAVLNYVNFSDRKLWTWVEETARYRIFFPIVIVILRHFSPLTRFWFFVSAHFSSLLCCARRIFWQRRHAVLCAPKRQFDSCLFPHSCRMLYSKAKQFHFSFDLPCSLEKTWWKIGEKEEESWNSEEEKI